MEAARVRLQNLQARFRARQREAHLAVEPARSSQRGIDRVRSVGRRDHADSAARVEPVHQRQERGDHRAVDRVLRAAARRARGREPVDLVEEDDGGRSSSGFLEKHAQGPLRLAHVLAQRVRALAREEGNRVRPPRRFRHQRAHRRGFSRARWSVQQHASPWRDAESRECLRVRQRQQRELLQHANLTRHAGEGLETPAERLGAPEPERTAHGDARRLVFILDEPSAFARRERCLVILQTFFFQSHALTRSHHGANHASRALDLGHTPRRAVEPDLRLVRRRRSVVSLRRRTPGRVGRRPSTSGEALQQRFRSRIPGTRAAVVAAVANRRRVPRGGGARGGAPPRAGARGGVARRLRTRLRQRLVAVHGLAPDGRGRALLALVRGAHHGEALGVEATRRGVRAREVVRSRARRERTPDGGAFPAAMRALQLLASLDRLLDVFQPLQTSVEVHLGAPQDAVLVRPGVFDAVLVGEERAREIAHRGRRHAASIHRGVDVREQPGRPVALRGGAEGAHARRLDRPLSGRREPVGRGAGGTHRARVTGRRGERTAFTPRVLDACPRVARSRVLFHRVRHARVSFRGHERRRNPRRGGLAHLAVADGQISFLDSL